jgi:hypothetical protein
MKKSVVLFFAFIFALAISIVAPVFCAAAPEPEAKELEEKEEKELQDIVVDKYNAAKKRGIFIFLDDSEAYSLDPQGKKHLGPASTSTLLAIVQTAGPILASGSILNHIFQTPARQDSYAPILTQFHSIFDPRDWIIRRVKTAQNQGYSELYCLIPKKYYNAQQHVFNQLKNPDQISPLEALLGIKIDHMEPIPDQTLEELRAYLAKKYNTYNQQTYPLLAQSTGSDFIINLPNLFVPKSYYFKNKQQAPQWVVVLAGHGGFQSAIASIPLKRFKTLLDYLETQLSTLFFIYTSCDAAGFNSQKAFNEEFGELIGRASAQTYSFYIITQALTDAPTSGPIISFNAAQILESNTYYHLFMRSIFADPREYKTALTHIFPSIKSQGMIFDTPQVRLPFMYTWIPLTEFDQAIVPITEIMSLTRKKALAVKPYSVETKKAASALKDPAAILLYANRVPFPIKVTTKTIPAFVSMAPGNTAHFIDELDMGDLDFTDFQTKHFPQYGSRKLFWFAKIKTKDSLTLKDVVIAYEPHKFPVFYWTSGHGTEMIYDTNLAELKESDYQSKEYSSYTQDPAVNWGLDSALIFRENIKKAQSLEAAIKKPHQTGQAASAEKEFFKNVEAGNIQKLDVKYINSLNENYQTPLMIAAKANDTFMIKFLLEHGARTENRDLEWKNAADYASPEQALLITNFNLRYAKTRRRLRMIFPSLSRAERRNLRYILEQINKKDPKASNFLKHIVLALTQDDIKKAVSIIHKAYGGSTPAGTDFTADEFDKLEWSKILISATNAEEFDFLDAQPMLESPELTAY